MNKNESIEFCKKKVNAFLEKYCDNQLEKLLTFDIERLKTDKEFGKPTEYKENWQMDPDDSIIAREVLFLLYNKKIKDLSYNMMGNNFRGDTIFTPGNIFGNEMEFLKHQDILNAKDSKRRASDFLKKYHTIPNMMLLPNEKIEVIRRNRNNEYISMESLNQYRGMNEPGLSDYIDLFIQEIYNSIEKNSTEEMDACIAELIQKNDFYFNTFSNGIQFLESHFLEDCVCKVGNTYKMIDAYKFSHVVWWKKTKDYDDEIDKFLNAFERLWAYRKEKILIKLQTSLKGD